MTTSAAEPTPVRTGPVSDVAARARDDLRPDEPAPSVPARPLRSVRAAGAVLAAGTLSWVAAIPFTDPYDGGYVINVVTTMFQLGVWALLITMWRTRATGHTRTARGMLRVEFSLLSVATISSFLGLMPPAIADSTLNMVLDVFWPLSMLGMAVIGIKVAVAGVWRGVLRAWPVVAETLVLVALPALAFGGPTVGTWVCFAHLLVGYTTLGVLLVLRPALTRR